MTRRSRDICSEKSIENLFTHRVQQFHVNMWNGSKVSTVSIYRGDLRRQLRRANSVAGQRVKIKTDL